MKLNAPFAKNISFVYLVFIFWSISALKAQNNLSSISGKVTHANGKVLHGVTSTDKCTSISTVTNETGDYTITVPSWKGSLIFSSVGYESEEISIGY